MKKFDGVKVEGLRGKWSQIGDPAIFNFRGRNEKLYKLEHDEYGEDTDTAVVDEKGKLIATVSADGFDDIQNLIDNDVPYSEW